MRSRVAVAILVCCPAVAAAQDADEPVPESWLHLRQMVGVAGWPSGLISDTRLQHRLPLHRSKSIVFQDTWVGFGARARVTPAFADVGPRISIAPIDVFDVELQVAYTSYWPTSSGLLPYDRISESTRDFDRGDRHRAPATRAKWGSAFTASAAPTLKAKVGPIIVLDGWKFDYFHIRTPNLDSRFVYEPFYDRLLAREDVVIDHQGALLYEVFDGKRQPRTLMAGALFKHQWVHVSRDSTMQLGAVVMFKPSRSSAWPTFAGQALVYLQDEDRVGGPPYMALASIWEFELRSVVHR